MTPTTTRELPLRETITSHAPLARSAASRTARAAPSLHMLAATAVFIFMAAVVLKLI